MTNLSYVTPKNDVEKISRELSWKRYLGRALEKFYVRLLKPSEIFTSKKSSPAADVLDSSGGNLRYELRAQGQQEAVSQSVSQPSSERPAS